MKMFLGLIATTAMASSFCVGSTALGLAKEMQCDIPHSSTYGRNTNVLENRYPSINSTQVEDLSHILAKPIQKPQNQNEFLTKKKTFSNSSSRLPRNTKEEKARRKKIEEQLILNSYPRDKRQNIKSPLPKAKINTNIRKPDIVSRDDFPLPLPQPLTEMERKQIDEQVDLLTKVLKPTLVLAPHSSDTSSGKLSQVSDASLGSTDSNRFTTMHIGGLGGGLGVGIGSGGIGGIGGTGGIGGIGSVGGVGGLYGVGGPFGGVGGIGIGNVSGVGGAYRGLGGLGYRYGRSNRSGNRFRRGGLGGLGPIGPFVNPVLNRRYLYGRRLNAFLDYDDSLGVMNRRDVGGAYDRFSSSYPGGTLDTESTYVFTIA